MDELETYQQKNNLKSVLLFPPLPSRLRYLIHKTIEDIEELSTFSVGEIWYRRVVVCYSELRCELEEDGDLENSSLCEESASLSEGTEGDHRPKSVVPSYRRAPRRPDKLLYTPRAARDRLASQNCQIDQQLPHCGTNSLSSSNWCPSPETTEDSPTQEEFHRLAERRMGAGVDEVSHPKKKEEETLRPQRDETHVLEQTCSSFGEMTIEEDGKDEEDPASDHGNPEHASIDTDDVIEEIKTHLKDALTVSIELVQKDYSLFQNVHINSDDFGHVIEIYDFPAVFKTEDLLDAFTNYSEGGMKIKWVDNTHALGVFSSEPAALHALSICHPLLKTRSLAQGSKKARGKALRRAEFIQPVKERPRTDCAVARRMVTRALGIRGRGRRQLF